MKSVDEQTGRVNPQWSQLLRKAVEEPGKLLEAYSVFHNYSLGNCMAAAWQCDKRGMALGPINTFMGWKALGRNVQKGEKALSLRMPFTAKAKRDSANGSDDDAQEFIRCFVWKAHWFVLTQTDGAEHQPEPFTAQWDKARALAALDIHEVPFEMFNGNVQGFAKERSISVSPIAQLPHKTLFHEIAHVVLGHTLKGECSDGDVLPRALKEVEAESVAMLLCETLQLPGCDYSRGYIQHWWQAEEIPEQSAQRIFNAAHKILLAGKVSL